MRNMELLQHLLLYSVSLLAGLDVISTSSYGRDKLTSHTGLVSQNALASWKARLLVDKITRHRTARDANTRQALHCPTCDLIHCYPKRASKLNCQGGVTVGVCSCCPRCAKLDGEPCGGKWDYLGSCDAGLECVPVMVQLMDTFGQDQSVIGDITEERSGVCRRVPADRPQSSEPILTPEWSPCQPLCTPEFCEENPKDICSAVDNTVEKMPCQGECQHTSCLACRFLIPEQDCGSCPANDMVCLKQYGRCTKQNVCSKKKFPCAFKELDLQLQSIDYKFQCTVPRCP